MTTLSIVLNNLDGSPVANEEVIVAIEGEALSDSNAVFVGEISVTTNESGEASVDLVPSEDVEYVIYLGTHKLGTFFMPFTDTSLHSILRHSIHPANVEIDV